MISPMTQTVAERGEPQERSARLVLSDGEVFEGEAIGALTEVASGEVVFNTVMCGYQEVISDPSLRRSDHYVHQPPHR